MPSIRVGDQDLELLPQKAVYWKQQKILIVSDTHFGKSAHFRSHGIYVPDDGFINDLNTLKFLFETRKPEKLIVTGDMFHSKYNAACEQFANFMRQYSSISVGLIKGNHDILKPKEYESLGIEIVDKLELHNILLVHQLKDEEHSSHVLAIQGHIHPAVRLKGKAKQHASLVCFYISDKVLTMPAFGSFTGNAYIKPKENDAVYAILANDVILL